VKRTKEDRKKVADSNKAICDSLTPQERIDRLDKRLGKGKGAQKERQKLKERIGE
jgi:hypothetical protein